MPAGAVPGEPAPGGYVAEVMGVLGGEAVSVTEVGGMSGGSVHGMSLSVSEGRDGLVNGTRPYTSGKGGGHRRACERCPYTSGKRSGISALSTWGDVIWRV